MRNIAISMIIGSLLLISSCSKGPTGTPNYWSFRTTSYAVSSATVSATNKTLVATDATTLSTLNTIQFSFLALPTISGSYQVVRTLTPQDSAEVIVTVSNGGNTYISTGNDYVSANITVNNGKIGIVLENAWLRNNSNPNDSAIVTANINQTN